MTISFVFFLLIHTLIPFSRESWKQEEFTVSRKIGRCTHTLGLESRKPPWKTAKDLMRSGFETKKCWRDEWANSTVPIKNKNLVPDPNRGVASMELPRHEWSVLLNRLRTGHGRCADMMFKWRLQISPTCDCAATIDKP